MVSETYDVFKKKYLDDIQFFILVLGSIQQKNGTYILRPTHRKEQIRVT